jgi:hypothetical protein
VTVEILRDHAPRWRVADEHGVAVGYGGTVHDAVMRWAAMWEACEATRMREYAQVQRLDASVA